MPQTRRDEQRERIQLRKAHADRVVGFVAGLAREAAAQDGIFLK